MTVAGMTTIKSPHPVPMTTDRLVRGVEHAGLQVFARIDHAAGAASVGMALRPTELLIFGNPTGGTPLMLDQQTAGIDLPVKALVWEDGGGQVWLGYNQAEWVGERHHLSGASAAAVHAITSGLAHLAALATAPE